MEKLLEAQIHEEPSFGAPQPFAKVVQSMQEKNNGDRKNRVKKIEDSSCSLLLHFRRTYWSPFSTCYIPFQSSGSQESNSSNGAWFGVETKELHPFQADYSKLKEDFCTAVKSAFCCEMILQPFCTVLWNSSWSFPIFATHWKPNTASWKPTSQRYEISLFLRSDFAALFVRLRNLVDLVFTYEMVLSASRYLCTDSFRSFLQIFFINFHSSPCNPLSIRFLS